MNRDEIRLMLCPRNFSGWSQVSHTGLAVSATNTAKVLIENGVYTEVRPVRDRQNLEEQIQEMQPTHVVINAIWLSTMDLAQLVFKYMNIQFVVLIHSNLAFLQVERNAIKLLHEAVDLELRSIGNFRVAANSHNGAKGLQESWNCPSLYLPNLYHLDQTRHHHPKPKWHGGTLRIGAFGAMRPLKNPTGSAFAALAIAHHLGANLEFHINVGRNDGGWMDKLVGAVDNIFLDLPHAKVVKHDWDQWAGFRRLVRHMHLLLQPSFTESFNVVTADGVAEGVASVVSDVIEWAPDHWKALADNTNDIARVGRNLLADPHSDSDGRQALTEHNEDGIRQWTKFLETKKNNPLHPRTHPMTPPKKEHPVHPQHPQKKK